MGNCNYGVTSPELRQESSSSLTGSLPFVTKMSHPNNEVVVDRLPAGLQNASQHV